MDKIIYDKIKEDYAELYLKLGILHGFFFKFVYN